MFIAIVPAYNEEKHIGSVVRDLFHHVDQIVVIDDCSSDTTAQLAQEAGAVVIRHHINRGQGAALETGHAYARKHGATFVLHFDADGQFDPEDIAKAKQHLVQSGADMLFGSRFLDSRSAVPWFKKYVLLPVGRMLDRVSGSPKLSDSHNGFRILNAHALAQIHITQDRMAHASEIPLLAKRANLSIVEFPVKVTYHEYGQSAIKGFAIIKDLLIGRFIR